MRWGRVHEHGLWKGRVSCVRRGRLLSVKGGLKAKG